MACADGVGGSWGVTTGAQRTLVVLGVQDPGMLVLAFAPPRERGTSGPISVPASSPINGRAGFDCIVSTA
jgi:hypothetical protein